MNRNKKIKLNMDMGMDMNTDMDIDTDMDTDVDTRLGHGHLNFASCRQAIFKNAFQSQFYPIYSNCPMAPAQYRKRNLQRSLISCIAGHR
jgi:endonuclease IV